MKLTKETNLYYDEAIKSINNKVTAKYGTSATAANVSTKTALILGDFQLYEGARISIYFTYGNSVENPTLNVNNTGAIPIYARGEAISHAFWWSNRSLVEFVYNGTEWVINAEDQEETFNRLTNCG